MTQNRQSFTGIFKIGNKNSCIKSSSLRTQPKRVNIGNWISVSICVAVESYCIGNFSCDYIGIDKSAKLRTVIASTHIDKSVAVGHHTVSSVIEENYRRSAGSVFEPAVCVIREGDGDFTVFVRYCRRASAVIKVINLSSAFAYFAYKTDTVNIFCNNIISCFNQKLT